jgi:hypothetical protein
MASTAMMNAARLLWEGRQSLGGLNKALLSFTAISGLSFRCANGMGPYENALVLQAEITIFI